MRQELAVNFPGLFESFYKKLNSEYDVEHVSIELFVDLLGDVHHEVILQASNHLPNICDLMVGIAEKSEFLFEFYFFSFFQLSHTCLCSTRNSRGTIPPNP